MTAITNARIAGVTFLAYIATGLADVVLFGRVAAGPHVAAKLATIAQHATAVRICALLELLTFFEATILAVTLYALTRDEDADVAMLAGCCRFAEGILGVAGAVQTMRLVSLAEAAASTTGVDTAAATALGGSLLAEAGSSGSFAATCFAVGSTLFAYLFLRARSIPVPLAWLGVVASVLVVIALPLRIAGFFPPALVWPTWMPMLVFEVALALWLILKGVRITGVTG